MVRCFIGVMLPENLKNKIVNIQKLLLNLPIKCKMVETENLHICLDFLGDVEERKIIEIKKSLDQLCLQYSSMNVEVSGINIIPNEKYIRVIALNCTNQTLKNLGTNIKNQLGGDAKPPHITLCRVKKIEEKEQTLKKIKEINSNLGGFIVSSIQLIKSQIEKSGPIYSILHESKLL